MPITHSEAQQMIKSVAPGLARGEVLSQETAKELQPYLRLGGTITSVDPSGQVNISRVVRGTGYKGPADPVLQSATPTTIREYNYYAGMPQEVQAKGESNYALYRDAFEAYSSPSSTPAARAAASARLQQITSKTTSGGVLSELRTIKSVPAEVKPPVNSYKQYMALPVVNVPTVSSSTKQTTSNNPIAYSSNLLRNTFTNIFKDNSKNRKILTRRVKW